MLNLHKIIVHSGPGEQHNKDDDWTVIGTSDYFRKTSYRLDTVDMDATGQVSTLFESQ